MEEEKMAGTMQAEGSYCDPERVDKATEPPDHEMATSGLEENTEMWMEGGGEPDDRHQRLEMDGDDEDESIFYGSFPTLPEFPCMSSSSSSSLSAGGGGGGGGVRPSASCSSSSSSTKMSSSWAVMKLDKEDVGAEKSHPSIADRAVPLPMTEGPVLMQQEEEEEGMDVLEEMGDMNLLDSSGMWDPSTLFNGDDEEKTEQQQQEEQEQQQSESVGKAEDDGFQSVEEEMMDDNSGRPSEDLAMVFFEWLKSNKESISPEDLRSIKLKRSTIECAARRLGGGKEGMKQLLKLILAWVQNHHLQKKRNKDEEYMPTTSTNPPPPAAGNAVQYQQQQQQLFPAIQVQLPSTNAADSSGPWMNPHLGGYLPHDPNAMPPQPSAFPHHMMMGFVGDGGFSGAQQQQQHPFSSPAEYHQMIESNMQWSPHFSCYGSGPFSDPSVQQPLVGFPNKYAGAGAGQFFQGHHHHGVFGEPLMKMTPSATKEARKKRMARQRRFFSHHHHHRHHNHHQQNHQHHLPTATTAVDQHQHPSRLAAGKANCTTATTAAQNSPGNWVMWPSSSSPSTSPSSTMLPSDADLTAMQPQQRPMPSDRRPGWKSEKNLRFLLQKVLKQSDVGNLGRIVLPKKEAETHLPELDARDGISIAMEDIGTSRIWNMRYRFWPNNKSRMYLLENTGDFVRTNGLQEGDFIVIYSDTKCGKYMIRGVKVRKPELKPDVKTTAKTPKASSSHVSSKEGGSSLPSCNR